MFTIYFQFLKTFKDWNIISKDFEDKWNFPLCLRIIDGKHIAIERPKISGPDYFNYKKFYSVVLLGVFNWQGKLSLCLWKNTDVINETSFYQKLLAGKLNVPQLELQPQGRAWLPCTLIADDGTCTVSISYETQNLNERIFN